MTPEKPVLRSSAPQDPRRVEALASHLIRARGAALCEALGACGPRIAGRGTVGRSTSAPRIESSPGPEVGPGLSHPLHDKEIQP